MTTNPFRGKDPIADPFVPSGALWTEEQSGTRHPSRFEPKQSTISSTQIQQRNRARVQRVATTLVVANNTPTLVPFDAEQFDTIGMHNNSVNNTRIVIPSTGQITGTWLIHAHTTWAASASGFRETNILQSGVQISSTHVLGSNDQQSQDATIYVNDPPAGTYFEVQVTQTTGGNLNLLTEPVHTYFEVIHLW